MFDEFKNAFQRPNNAHVQLIIINVVVFLVLVILYVFSSIGQFEFVFSLVHKQFLIPPKLSEFFLRPWTLITYAFAHDHLSVFHILFNMLGLYWFGKLIIEYLGSDKLVALYILGALAAGVVYLVMFNTIPYFINASAFAGMVGASGALYAVMVAAATLLPDYTFFLLFLGPVKIKYIVLFFILGSFIGTVGSNAGGNLAHLGGAMMGFVYIRQLQAGFNWGGWITVTLDWFRGLFRASRNVKVTYRKQTPRKTPANFNKATQEEIDVILDKISDRGYESLTKEEKREAIQRKQEVIIR